ncbi:MAG: hypothetical protein ABTQ73_12110 [Caldilineales bacterium]
MKQRPTGITILAILAVIGGILSLCGSLALFGLSGLGAVSGEVASGATGMLYGVIGLVGAVLYLLFGFGAWQLKPWAWTLGIAGAGLSIVSNVLSLISGASLISVLIGLIIPAIILWYLFRPEIKAVFGRS